MPRFAFACFAVLAAAAGVFAQGKAKQFSELAAIAVKLEPAEPKVGDAVILSVSVTTNPGAWAYAIVQPAGKPGSKTRLKPQIEGIEFEPAVDPVGWVDEFNAGTGETDRKYKSGVTWAIKGKVIGPDAKASLVWKGSFIQACNKDNCYPAKPENYPELDVAIRPGTAPVVPPVKPNPPSPSVEPAPNDEAPSGAVKTKPLNIADYRAKLDNLLANLEKREAKREGGVLALLLTAAFWGLVSLVTPCVFPMIPITVSLFLKQSNQSVGGAVKLAAIYCTTIVVVLGLSAVTLLSAFSRLSVNPFTNLVLGLLMLVFALSLFGMYDLTLPNWMLRYTEGKRKQGGWFGTVFGAIAFSIVSFTCVAPFLGGFAGMAASGQYTQFELILAGIAFAAAFAAPFFVLALFPSLLKQLPKSGGWLDTIKAVMGFLELAAAIKFFRTAELRLADQPTYFTYDVCLAAFIIVAAVCGLYLLNIFRLPHDEESPRIGVVRLLFALGFLGLAVYLTPGLFKSANGEGQRPSGIVFAWIDAFLLPENAAPPPGAKTNHLPWRSDLPDALKIAYEEGRRTGKPKYVFVDFTGVTCSNCKANERKVFPQPEIRVALERFVLVQLYTDDVPSEFFSSPQPLSARTEEAAANFSFQDRAFASSQLPLYAILEPTATGAKVHSFYEEGLINRVDDFAKFLKAPYLSK